MSAQELRRMTVRASTALNVLTALAALAALAGCASSNKATHPAASASGHDLQLRPVLAQTPIANSTCPSASHDESASTTPVSACSADGTTLYSLGAAAVSGEQVGSASIPPNTSGGPPGGVQIEVDLTSAGKTDLTTMTQDLATKSPPQSQMAIYVHGRVQSAPTVMEPITVGKVIIAGNFTGVQAQHLVDQINTP